MNKFSNVETGVFGVRRFRRDRYEDRGIVEHFKKYTNVTFDAYAIRYPVEDGREATASNIELDSVVFTQSFARLEIPTVSREVLLRDIAATIGDPNRAAHVARDINESFKQFLFPKVAETLVRGATLAEVRLTEIVSTNLSFIQAQIMEFVKYQDVSQNIPHGVLPKIMMHPSAFTAFLTEHDAIVGISSTPGERTLFGCGIVQEAQLPKNIALVGILPTDLPQHDLDRLPEAFVRMGIGY